MYDPHRSSVSQHASSNNASSDHKKEQEQMNQTKEDRKMDVAHTENHVPFWCPQCRKEAKETENALRSSTRQCKGLKNFT